MSLELLPSNQIEAISQYTFITKYARYDHKKKRRETWDEAVDRVRDMHLQRYGSKGIEEDINWAFELVREKRVLPSMRSLQFGGEAILANDARIYNCAFTHADRPRFFSEALWMLLSGVGVGFSIQKHHIAKLPRLIKHCDPNEKEIFTYTVADTIEGWADALDVLMSTYFVGTPNSGREVFFDFSRIRRKGTWLKTSGGRAPGADPLRVALKLIKKILRLATESGQERLKSIQVYDITMISADAVLSGGVRSSATIALFSEDDHEMMVAKTFQARGKVLSNKRKDGSWLVDCGHGAESAWFLKKDNDNPYIIEEPVQGDEVEVRWNHIMPWRSRSNNSVALLRNGCTRERFQEIVSNAKLYGEPGFVFLDSLEYGYNPCLSGDMKLLTKNGYRTIRQMWEEGGKQEYDRTKSASDYGMIDVINSNGVVPATNVYRTSAAAETFNVELKDGTTIKATSNHTFFVVENNKKIKRKLYELKIGDKIPDYNIELDKRNWSEIKSISSNKIEEVFCLTEPGNNEIVINGKLIGNCVEIGLNPVDPLTNETGWQVCNLTEINGGAIKSKNDFKRAVRAATIIGTLQAGYSYLHYLTDVSRRIIRRERLLGVSVTGWMENPTVLLDAELQREMAEHAVSVNQEYADKIGIEHAARVTCTKPAGSTSLILGTSSGIHPHHARKYFRRFQQNSMQQPLQFFKLYNPQAVEESVWGVNREVITFCMEVPPHAIIKDDLSAIGFLHKVRSTYQNWVKYGTAIPNSSPGLTHNVSNTVNVGDDEWDDVVEFVYTNRECFSGIALIPKYGDKIYRQAPNERVVSEEDFQRWNELVSKYETIDWTKFQELEDYTSLRETVACANGNCEL